MFFKWLKRMKRRTFCDTWKWREIQISMFINKVLLEHSHVSFSIAIKKLCNCDRDYMWPEKPKIFTLWPIRGKVCWSPFWSIYEPRVTDELGILCDPEIVCSICVHLWTFIFFCTRFKTFHPIIKKVQKIKNHCIRKISKQTNLQWRKS